MGHYTGFCFNLHLKQETPPSVITLLNMFVGPEESNKTDELAKDIPGYDRYWSIMFAGQSYYFGKWTTSRVDSLPDQTTHLLSAASCKFGDNYIYDLLEWLKPWLVPSEDFVAFHIYESSNTFYAYYLSGDKIIQKAIRFKYSDYSDDIHPKDVDLDEAIKNWQYGSIIHIPICDLALPNPSGYNDNDQDT